MNVIKPAVDPVNAPAGAADAEDSDDAVHPEHRADLDDLADDDLPDIVGGDMPQVGTLSDEATLQARPQTDPVGPRTAQVPLACAGRRFDQTLAELFPDYSRSRLTEWVKAGDALLDGRVVRPRDPVRGGEQVQLNARLGTETHAVPESIPLQILFEDDDVLVLDKPAGLVVHPGAGNPRGTLMNALLHHDPSLATLPRAGIVHRLDKETSGVMVVARSLRAHTSLISQLSGRQVHRQYVAVVLGALISGATVDAPIGRHPTDRVRMAVVPGGRDAITHYRVRERFRAHTLVECRLETGRTHQIRVHMAHARRPLVGDPLYGGALKLPKGATPALAAMLRSFKRQALHAQVLEFLHPATNETIRVQAEIPDDLAELVRVLRDDAARAG